jgi:hypothetical protein
MNGISISKNVYANYHTDIKIMYFVTQAYTSDYSQLFSTFTVMRLKAEHALKDDSNARSIL